MITEQLTACVSRMSEYCSEFNRVVYLLDGVEVLHACQTFHQYSNGPYYSRVNSCGEYRPQITKEQFSEELNRLKQLA